MKKVSKAKKYQVGGPTSSIYRPVQGAPKYTISPVSTKPTAKTTAKPTAKKPAAKTTYSAVKDIKSKMYPATGIPKTSAKTNPKPKAKASTKAPAKPTTKPATPKTTSAKTVSQTWAEKTGTSWSEAKKLGLTDGSAKGNMDLMNKLNKGTIDKAAIAAMKDNSKVPVRSVAGTTVTKSNAVTPAPASTSPSYSTPSSAQMSGSGMGAMERMEGMYKKGGKVKSKMKSKKK